MTLHAALRNLVPLDVTVARPGTGGEWSYVLFTDYCSWWAR